MIFLSSLICCKCQYKNVQKRENSIAVFIVDEAHCLTKNGLFNNYGVNQIEEIIKISNNSIFFVDKLQKVHLNDIGSIENISNIAKKLEL